MSWQAIGPQWVLGAEEDGYLYGFCEVCRAESGPTDEAGLEHFVNAHTAHQSTDFVGLGDAVTPYFTAVGKMLGLQHCTPCERRRLMLNGLAPRLWRR